MPMVGCRRTLGKESSADELQFLCLECWVWFDLELLFLLMVVIVLC